MKKVTGNFSKPPSYLSLRDGGGLFANVGPYWSASNAEFEATNPNFPQRVVRQLNPVTGLGSNLGQMHDAASTGSLPQAAMATVGALPMFAALRSVAGPAVGATKEAVMRVVPSLRATLRNGVIGAGVQATSDELQAAPRNKPR